LRTIFQKVEKEHKMFNNKKVIIGILSGILVTALAVGAFVFIGSASIASAKSVDYPSGFLPGLPDFKHSEQGLDGLNHPGGPGFPRDRDQQNERLAEALGITVEELKEALEKAHQAGLELAVEEGIITQDQADKILEGGFAFRRKPALGHRGNPEAGEKIDIEALLADALGISVTELQTAREEARAAALNQAYEDGWITQKQIDLMEAHNALKGYIDKEALLEEALGISPAELQKAREDGKKMPDLLDELGITPEEMRTAMQEAFEATVQQAVADGVISKEQADLILSSGFGRHGGFGAPHRPVNRGGRFGEPPEPEPSVDV
jgi:hypothetical protein